MTFRALLYFNIIYSIKWIKIKIQRWLNVFSQCSYNSIRIEIKIINSLYSLTHSLCVNEINNCMKSMKNLLIHALPYLLTCNGTTSTYCIGIFIFIFVLFFVQRPRKIYHLWLVEDAMVPSISILKYV